MKIFPAIDLYEGKAVRLFKGDYSQMTVYNNNPLEVAGDFEAQGAECLHLVDLEGAKNGLTPNLETVKKIVEFTRLFTEIGGGIRNMETVEKYLSIGVDRVILGTAAVENEDFLTNAVKHYGSRVAVGVDVKDGFVAIKGWTENPNIPAVSSLKKCRIQALRILYAPTFHATAQCREQTANFTGSFPKSFLLI